MIYFGKEPIDSILNPLVEEFVYSVHEGGKKMRDVLWGDIFKLSASAAAS